MRKHILGYARVSTSGQSLDIQIEQLKAEGADFIFEETASGAQRDRPELEAMMQRVFEGDTVVVTRLDRIARSTVHLLQIVENLKSKGVGFKVLNNKNLDTASPEGKLMLSMLGSFAEFERELLLERQREGIQRAKKEGKYRGRVPTARNKKDQVLELARQGKTKASIAKELGVSERSVYRLLREHKPTEKD